MLKRLHYSDADNLIAEGENETAQHLRDLLSCAKLLHAKRMEDKVGYMEARADALAELDGESTPLEKEFLKMQVDNDVELELEALKVKLQKS